MSLTLVANLGAAQAVICQNARAVGLGQSLLFVVTLYALAGALYLYACKTLQKDLVSKMS